MKDLRGIGLKKDVINTLSDVNNSLETVKHWPWVLERWEELVKRRDVYWNTSHHLEFFYWVMNYALKSHTHIFKNNYKEGKHHNYLNTWKFSQFQLWIFI